MKIESKSHFVMNLLNRRRKEIVPFCEIVPIYKDEYYLSAARASRSLLSVLRILENLKKISIRKNQFDFYIEVRNDE